MDRSFLVVAATDRADEIREHFRRSGHELVGSPWSGPGSGSCFAFEPPRPEGDRLRAPPADALGSVVSLPPFEGRLPDERIARLTGPMARIAEQLSRSLGIDVLVVELSDDPPFQDHAVWVFGAVEAVRFCDPERNWSWAPGRPLDEALPGASPWRERVGAFLASRPSSQAPARGEVEVDSSFAVLSHVFGRWLLVAAVLAFVAPSWIGHRIGQSYGHPDLGGFVGFLSSAGAVAFLTVRVGLVRLPSAAALIPPVLLGGAGLALLAIARSLAGNPAAPVAGTGGLLLGFAGLAWAWIVVTSQARPVPAVGGGRGRSSKPSRSQLG